MVNKKIPIWFQYKYYVSKYSDLSNMKEKRAYKHWLQYGSKENRICSYLPKEFLKICNIKKINPMKYLIKHYNENRKLIYKKSLRKKFNYEYYISKYEDIKDLNFIEAYHHFLKYGRIENRLCFDIECKNYCDYYKLKYKNVNDIIDHYLLIGNFLSYKILFDDIIKKKIYEEFMKNIDNYNPKLYFNYDLSVYKKKINQISS